MDGSGGSREAPPKLGRRRKAWATAAAVAAVAAIALAVALRAQTGDAPPDFSPTATGADQPRLGVLDSRHPEVGEPAPDFALVDARDGQTVRRLSDFRGQTVVLNWYASWCPPCQSEIPDFQTAYASLAGEIVVLAVNLQESPERAAAMLAALGATFPSVLDSDGAVARQYRLLGMPSTFFIDRDGIVRSMGSGRITAEALRDELAKLGHHY